MAVTIAPPPGLLISGFTINYTSPAATGTLSYQPANNSFGQAVITVTVMDNGSTANGGITSVSQNFTVTVNPVTLPPTLTAINDPAPIPENTTTVQTIALSGIRSGREGGPPARAWGATKRPPPAFGSTPSNTTRTGGGV